MRKIMAVVVFETPHGVSRDQFKESIGDAVSSLMIMADAEVQRVIILEKDMDADDFMDEQDAIDSVLDEM